MDPAPWQCIISKRMLQYRLTSTIITIILRLRRHLRHHLSIHTCHRSSSSNYNMLTTTLMLIPMRILILIHICPILSIHSLIIMQVHQ